MKDLTTLNKTVAGRPVDFSWRRRLWMLWDDIEWPVVLALGVVALLLGTFGFHQYYILTGEAYTWLDCLYQSILLFPLNAGLLAAGVPLPLSLQIARFLAPAVAAFAVIKAFMLISKEQLLLFRLVRMRDHVVVCGLGSKGMRYVKEFRNKNRDVVVVERDSTNPQLETCRELGAIIVAGDARDPVVLRKAGVERAQYLLAVSGEDGTNVEVAEQARRLAQGRQGKELNCSIHLTDSYLWTLLREREFSPDNDQRFRLDLFNIFDSGARMLLEEVFDRENTLDTQLHLLVVGLGDLGEALIVHAAQDWLLLGGGTHKRLPISVVDPQAEHKLEFLRLRFPLVESACRLMPHAYETAWPDFHNAEFIKPPGSGNGNPSDPVTHAFICLDDTSHGIRVGYSLLKLLKNEQAQIMIRMTEDSGLAAFLREARDAEASLANLRAFGLLDRTCKADLLDDGTHGILARVIHEDYVAQERSRGVMLDKNPILVPWEKLPEEIRQSNRRQADHIAAKLSAIGCGVAPWREAGKEQFPFTQQDILTMARMEHERWRAEKETQGWRRAPDRDNERKLHPDLIPWDDPQLSPGSRAKTIQAVQRIPRLLAQAGFQVYRLS